MSVFDSGPSPFAPRSGGASMVRGWFSRFPPVTAWLLQANLAVFAVTWLGLNLLRSPFIGALYNLLALSPAGLRHYFLWQPFTYMFLHSGFIHILFNMLSLMFLGPEVERTMGSRHFLAMYLLSGVLGGLGWLWLSTTSTSPAVCVGASGAIFGVFAAFATLYPRRPLTILIFLFPVTAAAWKIVLGMALLQFLLVTGGTSSNIAYTAHLAGALAGFLYVDQLFESSLLRRLLARLWSALGGPSNASRPFRSPFAPRRPAPPPSQAEIDRILDKISTQGIHTLTRKERQTLHRAANSL